MSLPENRIPTHPGEVLLEEFLIPMGLSQVALARYLGIPVQRVHKIVRGRHGMTPDTAPGYHGYTLFATSQVSVASVNRGKPPAKLAPIGIPGFGCVFYESSQLPLRSDQFRQHL